MRTTGPLVGDGSQRISSSLTGERAQRETEAATTPQQQRGTNPPIGLGLFTLLALALLALIAFRRCPLDLVSIAMAEVVAAFELGRLLGVPRREDNRPRRWNT